MPTNDDLLKRRLEAVAPGIASAVPVFCQRAENAEIWDVEGRLTSWFPVEEPRGSADAAQPCTAVPTRSPRGTRNG